MSILITYKSIEAIAVERELAGIPVARILRSTYPQMLHLHKYSLSLILSRYYVTLSLMNKVT